LPENKKSALIIIMSKLSGWCFIVFLCLIALFLGQRKVAAATLDSLPFGSVIQIPSTDTGMCDNPTCTTATSPVLPYKFVKMQARDQNGSLLSGAINMPGTNGAIHALVTDPTTGFIYAGGDFTTVGSVTTNGIAMWSGSSWWALGSGVDGDVTALAIDPATGYLYVGGSFSTAGGVTANNIALWNGSSWSALGSGTDNVIYALTTDSAGHLYAGGFFTAAGGVTANNIALWNGSSWSALGSGIGPSGSNVESLAINPLTGYLYAGGYFTTAGGVTANGIAMWSGSSWSALGSGPNSGGEVMTLAFDSSGNLYAGGGFYLNTADDTARNIAMWNGSSWSTLGDGLNVFVYALAIDPTTGNLYVGGQLTNAGNIPVTNIAMWNGSSWSTLGSGASGTYVLALTLDLTDNLYAGGAITSAGGVAVNNIARWNWSVGNTWSALGSGTNSIVQALAADPNTGNLYAGGQFTTAGAVTANYIAMWNGSSWSALGSGLNSYVSALAADPGGTIYAGGSFTTAGGSSANYIAMWSGGGWYPLGTGMNGVVTHLAFDPTNYYLYASGSFTTAGGAPANYIAMWDGSNWSALGSGFTSSSSITGLAVDAAGNLYASGTFTTAGGTPVSNIAMWDGSTWSDLGGGINVAVLGLALSPTTGNLYVGSGPNAINIGGTACTVAMWDGSSWSAVVGGVSIGIPIGTLTFDPNGNLYAAYNGAPGTYMWNGSSWSSLSSMTQTGGPGLTYALIGDNAGRLYAGGRFDGAGGVPANNIAMLNVGTWSSLNSTATYWAMLDNYCWWGSANCSYLGAKSAYSTTWNGNSTSDYNNNLSNPQTYNILTQLSNFYNSLPNLIGDQDKSIAIINNPYDLFGMALTTGTGNTTAGACATNWTAGTQTIDGVSYTFSSPAICMMTAPVGLLSYTDWQGGLGAQGFYPIAVGSGYSYCQARYGTDCTNGGTYNLFTTDSNAYGFPLHSAADPRPYYPWYRSPYAGNTTFAWGVNSGTDAHSNTYYGTQFNIGVSPALWLAPTNIICGSGTYADPYHLTGDPCNTPPTIAISTPTAGSYFSNQPGFDTMTVAGTVTDPDNDDQTVQYQIDGKNADGVIDGWSNFNNTSPNLSGMTGGSAPFSFNISTSGLAEGTHTLTVRSFDGTVYSTNTVSVTFNIDLTSPTIDATNSNTSASWVNTPQSVYLTAADPESNGLASGIATIRYAYVTPSSGPSPLNSACSSGGTALTSNEIDQATQGGGDDGTNGSVYALTVDPATNNLYVGGSFSTAGSVAADNIALWNGSAWFALGSGVNGQVSALAVDAAGNVYAGGDFTTAGGVPANHIAMWNGSNWSALGSGMNSSVYALTVDPTTGNLYAGGNFTDAGGSAANYIAMWNGSNWSVLGGGMNNSVAYLAISPTNGNLYAGGGFTTAGGITTNGVAMWNGSGWSALGSGIGSRAAVLAVDSNGSIYATSQGSTTVSMWNGSSWSAFGSNTNNAIWILIIDPITNYPIIANGMMTNYILEWNGSSWVTLANTGGFPANALAADSTGYLYAAGAFGSGGNITANHIAMWNGSVWSPLMTQPFQLPAPPMSGATLYLCAADAVGNVGMNQGGYYWENIPPTVTQTPDALNPGTAGVGVYGIYSINPTITIQAADEGGSGVAAIRFDWDTPYATGSAEPPNWQHDNDTTSIPSVGTHTLYYQSLDNAGNVSQVGTAVYQLDTQAPTLQTAISGGTLGNAGWYTAAPALQVTGIDTPSEGVEDNTLIAQIVSDLQRGTVNADYAASGSATNLINSPAVSSQTTSFQSIDPVPRQIAISPGSLTGGSASNPDGTSAGSANTGSWTGIPANGVFTAYYYAANTTPLYSVIGTTTFNVDSQAPTGYLTSTSQTGDSVDLQYTISDDYYDSSLGQNILSAFTSGVAACDLQESVAVFNADGTLGPFSPFATILSDCGSPESTNSANSTLLTATLTQPLAPGRVYQYQLNLTDMAGNSSQLPLLNPATGQPFPPGGGIVSSFIPALTIFNLNQNQSAFPNTYINISGVVTDLDQNQTITVAADIAGVTKSVTFPSPIANQGFTFSWQGSELPLGAYGNAPDSLGGITITADDGDQSTAVTYQGVITSRPAPTNITNDDITSLYNQTYSRFAGALFFKTGTLPNLRDPISHNLTFTNPAANDYYCLDDGSHKPNSACTNLAANSFTVTGETSTQSAQVWYKDITAATNSATATYPFIVQFYDQPETLEELHLNDSGW